MLQETFEKMTDLTRKKKSLKHRIQDVNSLFIMNTSNMFDEDINKHVGQTLHYFVDENHILNPLWQKFLEDAKMILTAELQNTENAIEQL